MTAPAAPTSAPAPTSTGTSAPPPDEYGDLALRRQNIRNVQRESAAIGVFNGASVFLPVFILRLGGSNLDVSLLTAIPAFAGFFLSIPAGSFLQRRRNVIRWYTLNRGLLFSSYTAIAVVVGIMPAQLAIPAILLIWILNTVPSTVSAVASNVILNVAGPSGRYDVLSRRYGLMGLTAAITAFIAGQLLERFAFPINYQLFFVIATAFGLLACTFAIRIVVPDQAPADPAAETGIRARLGGYVGLLRSQPPFLRFVGMRSFVTFGTSLAAVLVPLWLIREANASDSWVGIIATAQSAAALAGYYVWRRVARRRTGRSLLALTTFGIALYPIALAATTNLVVIAVVAGYAALMAAGLNLVLFDELMRTVPAGKVVTFSGVDSAANNLTTILGPLTAAFIADRLGIATGLVVAGVVTLIGAALLTTSIRRTREVAMPAAGSA
jgi:hypothetical protein